MSRLKLLILFQIKELMFTKYTVTYKINVLVIYNYYVDFLQSGFIWTSAFVTNITVRSLLRTLFDIVCLRNSELKSLIRVSDQSSMYDFSKVTEHKIVFGQWSQVLRHKVKPSRSLRLGLLRHCPLNSL